MKLNRLLAGTLALVLVAGLGTPAFANIPNLDDGNAPVGSPQVATPSQNDVLIDFEACTPGLQASYSEDGAIVTGVGASLNCLVLPGTCTGICAVGDGGGVNNFFPVRTDFASPVTKVTADVGDQSTDNDGSVFLEAYDVNDQLVDSDFNACGLCLGFVTLTVSAPNISYVITGSTINSGGSSVAVDNIVFTTQLVGGEFLSIDTTALMLAGLQSSAIWMLPILAGAAGIGAFYIKTRMNKD